MDTRSEDTALEKLRVAYARGELADEEFETRRERLKRED
ncbi:SHOCT domain-containing protein [Natronomonas halophila]|nr:SHOCT domain-containing protein [Natronomonas halophila]